MERCTIKLHWGTLPFAAFFLITGELLTLLSGIAALLLHEAAHVLVAVNHGFSVETLTVYPFGAVMQLSGGAEKRRSMASVAVSGPLSNFIAATVTASASRFFPDLQTVLEPFLITNMMLTVLNLLPACPLDGGRLLQELLALRFSAKTVRVVCLSLTVLTGAALLGLFACSLMLGIPAYSLLLLTVYLLTVGCLQLLRNDQNRVSAVLCRRETLYRGGAIPVRMVAVNEQITAGEALREIRSGAYGVLRVLDVHRHPVGELDEGMLLEALAKHGYGVPLKEILRRN